MINLGFQSYNAHCSPAGSMTSRKGEVHFSSQKKGVVARMKHAIVCPSMDTHYDVRVNVEELTDITLQEAATSPAVDRQFQYLVADFNHHSKC